MTSLPWLLAFAPLAYALVRIFGGYAAPRRPAAVLSRRELGFLDAAADTLFPPGGAIPLSGREAGVPAYVDRYVEAVPRRMRLLMRLLFFLVEHATVFFPAPGGIFGGGMRRFSALDQARREAALAGWQKSGLFPRRLVFTSLRAILTMGFFASPPVLRALRLAPLAIETPVCEADLLYPRIGARPESIRFTAASLTPPSDGTPLDLDGPLHAGYAGGGGR
jgi:hypothetical protein